MDTQITTRTSMLTESVATEFEELGIWDEAALAAVSHRKSTLIQTVNSFYLFLLTDPTERRGLLVGGALGEGPASAVLLGAIWHSTAPYLYRSGQGAGLRAVFLVESDGRWKNLITSRVVSLAHAPVQTREPRAAAH